MIGKYDCMFTLLGVGEIYLLKERRQHFFGLHLGAHCSASLR